MEASVALTTRSRWLDFLAHLTPAAEPEHRRSAARYPLALGGVRLAFEAGGQPEARPGKLLNASAEGVMIRQYQPIDAGTLVLIRDRKSVV